MTEQDLIYKIQELKSIKPREDWALSVKRRIFSDHPYVQSVQPHIAKNPISIAAVLRYWAFQPRMAYVSLLIIAGIFVSALGSAGNALPGDFLYPFKKITESGQVMFVLDNKEYSKTQLTLLNKRLDELTEVAKQNKVRNLAPAINEVEKSIAQAAKGLKSASPDQSVVSEVKKIEDKTTTIKSLGVEIGELEWDAALIQKIKDQVDLLSAEKLTAEQSAILEEVKQDIEKEEYAKAWEKVLIINGIITK